MDGDVVWESGVFRVIETRHMGWKAYKVQYQIGTFEWGDVEHCMSLVKESAIKQAII